MSRPPLTSQQRRVIQAARLVKAARHAWDGRNPPGQQARQVPARAVPARAVPVRTVPARAGATTAAPPAAAPRRPDDIVRVGRVAARITWAVAAVALVALAGVQGLIAVLGAASLPGSGVRHTTVLALIVVLLLACALSCLACVPGCAARALRRRVPVRRVRHPRALLVGETVTRVLAGACLIVAALWAHDVQHYGHGAGGLPVGTATHLAPIGLHPAALIVAGLAAAALSFRWSRARHRGAGAVSRRTPRSAGTSR